LVALFAIAREDKYTKTKFKMRIKALVGWWNKSETSPSLPARPYYLATAELAATGPLTLALGAADSASFSARLGILHISTSPMYELYSLPTNNNSLPRQSNSLLLMPTIATHRRFTKDMASISKTLHASALFLSFFRIVLQTSSQSLSNSYPTTYTSTPIVTSSAASYIPAGVPLYSFTYPEFINGYDNGIKVSDKDTIAVSGASNGAQYIPTLQIQCWTRNTSSSFTCPHPPIFPQDGFLLTQFCRVSNWASRDTESHNSFRFVHNPVSTSPRDLSSLQSMCTDSIWSRPL